METGRFRFAGFELDVEERRLLRDGAQVELNSRYLDALALLIRESGRLVSKERFLSEVWRGVPVTDEALTQCIKTLRRQLNDDASNPRFIETVPKHGYRFIGPVAEGGSSVSARRAGGNAFGLLAAAGTIGGGLAGVVGGLIYGVAAASQARPGTGGLSILLVLLCLCSLVALMGGAAVSGGIALAQRWAGTRWYVTIAGGALGGMFVGGLVKLLGVDAFNLLLGQSPGDITGAPEGAILGAASGLGAWLALDRGRPSLRLGASLAGTAGVLGGVVVIATGGRLMAGSLTLLGENFRGSQMRLFTSDAFGPVGRLLTGALEGGLFCACVVGAMVLARKALAKRD